jgi:hypothetical protein
MALLLGAGWTPAFAALAGAGLVTAVLALAVVRDRPADGGGRGRGRRAGRTGAAAGGVPVGAALREPGTWMGFFAHFVCLFPMNTFVLLWGVPFLTTTQGLSQRSASHLLVVSALAGLVSGPVTGELEARHPLRRSWLVIGAAGAAAVAWATVLVPDTPRPVWHLAVLVAVMTVSATASNVGFDFVRAFVPPERLGTATGVVIVGGFLSSLVAIFLVGLVLDLARPGGAYTLDDFRLAFTAQGLLWAVGLAGLLVARRATRRVMAERGVVVPPIREVVARLRAERRSRG